MRYLKYISVILLFAFMYLIGLVLVPFLYPFRKFIHKYKIIPFWYFLNDTEGNKDAGDYGRYSHNFIGFYRQCALRNSTWNLKLALKPKQGIKKNVKGNLQFYNLLKPLKFGCQFATYEIKGSKYFRFSFTKKFIFIFNMQLGMAYNRYLFKIRINL